MKIFKSKTFYVSVFAAALFAVGAYHFASNTTDTEDTQDVAQQQEQTQAPTAAPTFEGYEAVSAGSFTPDVENVSHTKRPVVIYVRRIDEPVLCADPTNITPSDANAE